MPLAPPVIKIVLFLSFIIKYPGKFSHGSVFHAVPRRSLCSAEASAVKSDPPSHPANPGLEPPRLERDQSRLLEAVRQHSYALQGRQQMNRETPHVVVTAHRAELYLDPRQVLPKEHCGQLSQCSPLLAQFGTERSN